MPHVLTCLLYSERLSNRHNGVKILLLLRKIRVNLQSSWASDGIQLWFVNFLKKLHAIGIKNAFKITKKKNPKISNSQSAVHTVLLLEMFADYLVVV